MKRALLLFVTIILSIAAFAQPFVWKSYYSRNSNTTFADNGNYINSIQANQLVQFQKSAGYFGYVEIPKNVMPCNSSHDSLQYQFQGMSADHSGNLWISTMFYTDSSFTYVPRGGELFKYDGATWTSFTSTLLSAGLDSNALPVFDPAGNMWFVNTYSLVKYDGSQFIKWDTINSALPKTGISANVQFDTSGNIWTNLGGAGVLKFDGTTFTVYDSTAFHTSGPVNAIGISYNKLNNNVYAVIGAYDSGYYQFDGSVWTHKYLDTLVVGTGNQIVSIFFDNAGNTFFNCLIGFYKYNGTTLTSLTNVPGYTYNNNFPITDLDANGDMWMIVNNIFCKFDGSNFTTYNDPKAVLENNLMVASVIDSQGSSWFSYWGAGGLTKFQNNNFVTAISGTNSGWSNVVYAMALGDSGLIWYGGQYGLHTYNSVTDSIKTYDYSTLSCSSFLAVTGINIDKNRTVWAVGQAAGACGSIAKVFNDSLLLDGTIGFNSNYPSCITSDTSGTLWIGSLSYNDGTPNPSIGLVKYDGTSTTVYDTSNSGIPENEIIALTIDPTNRLWVGTANKGVGIFDGSTWTYIDTSNAPLPCNHIENFLFKNGKTYIATQEGFSILDNGTWSTYTTTNSGLVNGDIESMILDNNCNLWLATECGLDRLVGNCGNGEQEMYGIVQDDQNMPLPNSDVYLMKLDAGRNKLVPIDNTVADAAGQYAFSTTETAVYAYAVPNKTIHPDVFPGYSDSALVQQISPVEHFSSPTVRRNITCAKKSGTPGNLNLNGTLINTTMHTVNDIRLFLMLNGQPVATTVSGIDGRFSFQDVAAGTYTVWVDKMGVDNTVAPSITLSADNAVTAMLHDTYLQFIILGVEQPNNKSLDIFPNPSHGRITCNVQSDVSEIAFLSVYDVNGTLVHEGKVSNGTQTIDLSSLPNGVYIVQVVSSFATQQERLVIVK